MKGLYSKFSIGKLLKMMKFWLQFSQRFLSCKFAFYFVQHWNAGFLNANTKKDLLNKKIYG